MNLRLPPALEAILNKPTWPGTIERPLKQRNLGVDYDTTWARKPVVRAARTLLIDSVTVPLTKLVTTPEIIGAEHLDPLTGPVIFAANHSSHLDTAVVLSALPQRFRHKTVVAAAADNFFERKWKAGLWAFLLGTIPVERTKVNRRSADLAAELIDDGWSLVIFPEGGRNTDGWGQEFRGGAAYLAKRCAVPVVPIHLRGVRPIFPKGSGFQRPGKVEIRIGDALRPFPADADNKREEDARRFAGRVEAAVAVLADEAETDWWSARQRAAQGTTPPFRGPEASAWRRSWDLPDSARNWREKLGRKHIPW